MGGKYTAGDSSDLCKAKQSFPCRLQRFSRELSLTSRNARLECLRAHSEHADDTACAPLRKLGRIFCHPQQGDAQRFASKISQSGTPTENRDGGRERRRAFDRRNLSAVSGCSRAIATE